MKINFGTDGIRNKVGLQPFTKQSLSKLTNAIALWSISKYQNKNLNFIICNDPRESSQWVKSLIKSNLLLYPFKVYDAGILPTPGIFHLMKNNKTLNVGIIVSASHNQYNNNGIKLVANGNKLSKEDEQEITSLFQKKLKSPRYNSFGTEIFIRDNAENEYIKTIISYFEPNFLKNIKIVVDTANGATHKVAEEIFKKLGANLTIINNNPNGRNINKNCGSLHPDNLIRTVKAKDADIGFAFDGDGDRIIAVNKKGQIKDGDDILAILSGHPTYLNSKEIVGTIVSNLALEAHLKNTDKKLIRTQVGDKNILKILNKKNLLLGGEQSGHIILNDIIKTGDGILVALKIIESIKTTNNWSMETFEKFPQIQASIPVKTKKELNDPEIKKIIESTENYMPNGKLIVRYSGTENVLRVTIQEKNKDLAYDIRDKLIYKLKQVEIVC